MKMLFYNDSPVFGGHEKSLFYVLEYLMECTDLHLGFIFYKGNTRFNEYLNQIAHKDKQRVTLYPINYYSGRLQCIKTLLSFNSINYISNLLNIYNPDIVIVVQGSIELSSLGLVAAKKSGYITVSFIPMTFKFQEIGIYLGRIRDSINAYFYSLPDRFITISFSMHDRLIQHGISEDKVKVVYVGIDTSSYSQLSQSDARLFYNLKEDDFIMAIIGRVQFRQKGHDLLIHTLSENLNKLKGFKLLVVGDGLDLPNLKSIVTKKNLQNHVNFIPWSNDLHYLYSAIDMLIIPSRFEGMPLVMLEAMYYGIPVIASNQDGMKELLPAEWLFNCNNNNSIIASILKVKDMNQDELIKKNKIKVNQEFNTDVFGKNFYNSISDFLISNEFSTF
jgi:glycosyltransferase involved in cell wall biosynthesis